MLYKCYSNQTELVTLPQIGLNSRLIWNWKCLLGSSILIQPLESAKMPGHLSTKNPWLCRLGTQIEEVRGSYKLSLMHSERPHMIKLCHCLFYSCKSILKTSGIWTNFAVGPKKENFRGLIRLWTFSFTVKYIGQVFRWDMRPLGLNKIHLLVICGFFF